MKTKNNSNNIDMVISVTALVITTIVGAYHIGRYLGFVVGNVIVAANNKLKKHAA